MADKNAATYHGIGEEFQCEACGDTYLSPRAAIMCEMRDTDEANQARKAPKPKGPSAYVRAYD